MHTLLFYSYFKRWWVFFYGELQTDSEGSTEDILSLINQTHTTTVIPENYRSTLSSYSKKISPEVCDLGLAVRY